MKYTTKYEQMQENVKDCKVVKMAAAVDFKSHVTCNYAASQEDKISSPTRCSRDSRAIRHSTVSVPLLPFNPPVRYSIL